MVDNLGNQLVDACEHIGLIGEAITSTFELLDLTVDALYQSVRVGRFGGLITPLRFFRRVCMAVSRGVPLG